MRRAMGTSAKETKSSTVDFFAMCDAFRLAPSSRRRRRDEDEEDGDDGSTPTVIDAGDGTAPGGVGKRSETRSRSNETTTTTTMPMMTTRDDIVDDETFDEAWGAIRAWRVDDARGDGAARVDDFHAFLVNDLNGRREPGFQCLVAALMSVQCLDKVALRAFERLRERVPDSEVTAEAIRELSVGALEEACKTLNLWTSKVKYIKECADVIHYRFRGRVPRTVGALKTLPGVGDKLAHLLSSVSFDDGGGGERGRHFAGVVVDTHVKRVSKRLGWTRASDDPERVRMALQARVRREDWQELSLDLIALGQNRCASISPSCGDCPVRRHCPSARTER